VDVAANAGGCSYNKTLHGGEMGQGTRRAWRGQAPEPEGGLGRGAPAPIRSGRRNAVQEEKTVKMLPEIEARERQAGALAVGSGGVIQRAVDGDPFVLIAPAPLTSFYRTSMDYSTSWADASFTRGIRFVGWLMALYLPALYVALSQVNLSLLPSALFIIMSGSHAGLPFSPLVEVVLMIVIIEILREAAMRLPQTLSVTIGTVGAIVVGTAVVRAGLVDPQIIVMMTLTALSLFSTPVYELVGAWRLLGFALLLAGAGLGVLGLVLVSMLTMAVICDMQTFGVPYFTPWAPFRLADWSDTLARLPWTGTRRRPGDVHAQQTSWRRPTKDIPRPDLGDARRQS
jgi:spore germination protein KA